MSDVLALCRDRPEVRAAKGEVLIEEAVRTDRLYVLKAGAFEVVRKNVRVTFVNEPGALLGEISAVLGSATSRPCPRPRSSRARNAPTSRTTEDCARPCRRVPRVNLSQPAPPRQPPP